jgi:hypothetical protein
VTPTAIHANYPLYAPTGYEPAILATLKNLEPTTAVLRKLAFLSPWEPFFFFLPCMAYRSVWACMSKYWKNENKISSQGHGQLAAHQLPHPASQNPLSPTLRAFTFVGLNCQITAA